MHLLNTTTLRLENFIGKIPLYTILSHTWGDGEVTFDDIGKPFERLEQMQGFEKVKQCCQRARADGFEWTWIDTCCIDKRSSAELSEAINSMFQWYWDAEICYAVLEDVVSNQPWPVCPRWFTRGWTLQELRAPAAVEFFNCNWQPLGSKLILLGTIHVATQIDKKYVLDRNLIQRACIAVKFSWAANRKTTRTEDSAYCLLGLVSVNMPMLYGEGERAFQRLQLEFVKQNNEHSIFAWETYDEQEWWTPVLAPSLSCFASCKDVLVADVTAASAHEFTNSGLKIRLPCIPVDDGTEQIVAVLNCMYEYGGRLALRLGCGVDGKFYRFCSPIMSIKVEDLIIASPTDMFIIAPDPSRPRFSRSRHPCYMRIGRFEDMVPTAMTLYDGYLPTPVHTFVTAEDWLRHVENMPVIEDGQIVCLSLEIGFVAFGLLYSQPLMTLVKRTESISKQADWMCQHFKHLIFSQDHDTGFFQGYAEGTRWRTTEDVGLEQQRCIIEAKKIQIQGQLCWTVEPTVLPWTRCEFE